MKNRKIFTVNNIRQSWLDIFKKYGYSVLKSRSIVPENDDSLLWVNSGVAALKKYFNKSEKLISNNIVNFQPVIRTDDLSRVEETNSFHQTLFEMLGCFSIGGNFKKETISIIWEWLTDEKWLNLPKNRLFITVFKDDKESFLIWNELGVKKENILLGSKDTNFWDLGNGPCGANSEIYFKLLDNNDVKNISINDLDSKDYIEIGNIVFPDLFHNSNDNYSKLEEKCVDTGFGLERVAMIIQKKTNTMEIDSWNNAINTLNF